MNPDDTKPLVYVLGDSISIQYGPYLKQFIAPKFRYTRKGEGTLVTQIDNVSDANGGDSHHGLRHLQSLLADNDQGIRYLLWNCGLHDIKTTAAGHQIEPDAYVQNLRQGMTLIQQRGIRPIWMRTTPAFEEVHNNRQSDFQRFHRDVIDYNLRADRIMNELDVFSIDLYTFTLDFCPDAFMDHVHFHEEMRKLQAAFIAGHLLAL